MDMIKAELMLANMNPTPNITTSAFKQPPQTQLQTPSNEIEKSQKSFENYENNKLFLKHKSSFIMGTEEESFFTHHEVLKYLSLSLTILISCIICYYVYLFLTNSNNHFNTEKLKEELKILNQQEPHYSTIKEDVHTIPYDNQTNKMYYVSNLEIVSF